METNFEKLDKLKAGYIELNKC